MIIIFVELYIIAFLIGSLEKQGVRKITQTMLFAFLVQSVILLIYRLELSHLGREVYYSDAEIYWQNTQLLLDGGSLLGSQTGYAYFCALLQWTSPVQSVLWNNISNILLVDLSVLLIGKLMADNRIVWHNICSFVSICVFNPLVIYSLGRNLKDALFLAMAVAIVFCYLGLSKKRKALKLLAIIALTAGIATVRPWGFLIPLLLPFERLFSGSRRTVLKRIMFFAFFFGIAFWAVSSSWMWRIVKLWTPIVFENSAQQSLASLAAAPLKALTGPGPLRSFLGHEYFLFYTYSGNIFSAIGACMWWWNIANFVTKFRKPVWRPISICFGLIWLFFLTVYSMQYGGSLELRFRGVVYILTSAMVYPSQENWLQQKATPVSVLAFIFIGFFATLFSI